MSVGRALKHDGAVSHTVFSPDGHRVLTASEDGKARLWDVPSGNPLATFLHDKGVKHASFSPDGKRVVTASRDRTARVWIADPGVPATALMIHGDVVNHASFSPDGRHVVTASNDWSARIWDSKTGKPVAGPLMHNDAVSHASFSRPDGRHVVTASRDHTAGVWDAATGAAVTPRMHMNYRVNHVSFSPDGRFVLTASGESDRGYLGEARLWDAKTAEPITPILKHRDGVSWASFSPTGSHILTTSLDETARVWLVPFDARPADDLRLIARMLSGYRLDATHGFVPAELADLREEWQILRTRYPEEFTSSTAERIAWHEREADDCTAQKHWFAAAWHFDRLVELDPDRWQFRARRGDTRAEQDDWTAAASDYAKAIELGADDAEIWAAHAVLRLEIGDVEGYRAACQSQCDRLAQSANPITARSVVAACVLAPQVVADSTQLTRIAECAATHPYSDVYLSMLGAASYRADQFDAALKHLGRALEIKGVSAGRDWLFSAMAHHRLGHADDARQALDMAVQRIDGMTDDPAITWDGRLGLRRLRNEAETLLGR
jgi:tetratricopeptide (TPR) repeat protein